MIRDRKPNLCGDLVSMNLVLEDDVANVDADMYLMTHTTNPLLNPDTIQKAIKAFKEASAEGKADSLFSVNKIQTRFYRADGSAVNHDPNNLIRTQDLEPWFEENSNFYIFTRESFNATRARIGKKPMLFEMSRIESTDIDEEEDWQFAVIAAKYLEASLVYCSMKVLVTCPPMLGMIDFLKARFEAAGVDLTTPDVTQTLSVEELKQLVPQHDGWIIGDDPATREVFEAGVKGKLKAAVKWGVGVDNVNFDACREFGLPITNTPNMFGREVADIALGYLIALARETFQIDRSVRRNEWIKPRGISLAEKQVALIGFGDIGTNIARRLLAAEMKVVAYNTHSDSTERIEGVEMEVCPERIEQADFIVAACSLTPTSKHMLNAQILNLAKNGVRIVNVARGQVIKEDALEAALESGKVHSAALDVFETEPLPADFPLRSHPRCIFGSHNASNTSDAVLGASEDAINKLFKFLKIN